MQYTQLGKTDLMVSRICFGCWQLSPRFWGNVPLDEWREAVRRAPDLGVNFIDTAQAYGDGYAESALGDVLAKDNLRDRYIIATKFFWDLSTEERFPNTTYEYILGECEASLKRLRTDRIDLYQIHSWDPLTRPDEVAAALGQLKKQGKVRWIGVSNLNDAQMRMYQRYFEINCLQPPYSLVQRDVEARELPFCLEHRIGVIAYSPLYRGLLTGKYTAGQKFGDHRDEVTLFKGKSLQRMLDSIAQLKPFAEKHGLTLPQLAVRWVLTHPALTSAIVGVKKSEHLETIVAAADGALPLQDWHKIAAIIATAKKEAEALAK